MKRSLASLLLAASLTPLAAAHPPVLWYRQPAAQWVEALPVGNDTLGAMVYGGAPDERI